MAGKETIKYILGGSSEELDRIQGVHETIVSHIGTLLLAPVDFSSSHIRILDSGTAGGRWLRDLRIEYGDEHDYVGTDITGSFFPQEPKPEDGITYKMQDVTQPWPQDWLRSFDLVHQRFVLGGVKQPSLKDAVMNLINLTSSGGWISLMESDVSEDVVNNKQDGAADVWQLLRHLYMAMGVEPDPGKYLRGWFGEAGLVDIHEERILVPVGAGRSDPEMAEKSSRSVVVTAQHLAMGAKQVGIPGFPAEDLDALPLRVQTALEKEGGALHIYVIWARRP
ncbi:S-adenosyl-L-methionine-dependent methyltransferase [Hypoxylon cercidicola]|nr:S-adenosyl-L-methionine-dependent methyltransferase [Hypoxylon cercidicola]